MRLQGNHNSNTNESCCCSSNSNFNASFRKCCSVSVDFNTERVTVFVCPLQRTFFFVAKRTSEVSFREQTNGFFLSPSKNLYFLVKRVPPLSRTSARRYYFSTLVGSLARSRVVRAMEFGLEVCAELMWILDGCLPKLKRVFVDLSDNGTERSFHR
jgi:hypothetical protein